MHLHHAQRSRNFLRAWRFSKENRYDLRTNEEAGPNPSPAQLRLAEQLRERRKLGAAVVFFLLVLLLTWFYFWC